MTKSPLVTGPPVPARLAVEGLAVDSTGPGLGSAIVPLTVAILLGLFLVQRRGTAGIGRVFGPVTLVWFATIAVLGPVSINGNLRDLNVRLAAAFVRDDFGQ